MYIVRPEADRRPRWSEPPRVLWSQTPTGATLASWLIPTGPHFVVALLRDRTPELCETFDSEADALARIEELADTLTTDARLQ